jgi:uncharacterized protein (TIGR03435 family)
MKETPPDDASTTAPASTNVSVSAGRGSSTNVELGNGASLVFGETTFEAKRLTMTTFADQLGRFMDHPVVDMTELKGAYDFKLEFQMEDFRAMRIRAAVAAGVNLPPQALKLLENASDGPMISAVQTLGLKLESRKAPLDVMVVDSVLKAPTEN